MALQAHRVAPAPMAHRAVPELMVPVEVQEPTVHQARVGQPVLTERVEPQEVTEPAVQAGVQVVMEPRVQAQVELLVLLAQVHPAHPARLEAQAPLQLAVRAFQAVHPGISNIMREHQEHSEASHPQLTGSLWEMQRAQDGLAQPIYL
jgi:hypothetical protein